MNTPVSESVQPGSLPGHGRLGSTAVISRTEPLPDICILSGEPATRRITCLFHWKTSNFEAGVSEIETLLRGLVYYVKDVPKALLKLPLSDRLLRRRRLAWVLVSLSVIITIATVVGLLLGQQWINALPPGPNKKSLNDLLIPGIALGGFIGMLTSALVASRIMPMLTVRLRAVQITETQVLLAGAAPEFLDHLPELPGSLT